MTTETESIVNSAEDTVMRKRREYCEGLQALAQLLSEHPELDLPDQATFHIYVWGKGDFVDKLKKLGACRKIYTEYSVTIAKEFGPISYGYYINRDAVCERKVVGKKAIPAREAYIVPAQAASEEDIVQWECGSVLKEVREQIEQTEAPEPSEIV